MLFKRYLFLAACVLLFLVAYFARFSWAHSDMESQFRAERIKYGVEGAVLTANNSVPDASTPASPPATTPPPSAPAPDTNTLIGPVPPQSSPDNTPAPSAPAPPDSNSAPAAPVPAPSTMNDRRENQSPFFLLAGYHPSEGIPLQAAVYEPALAPAATPAVPPVAAPSGTASSTNAAASTAPATNAPTSIAPPGPVRAAPVEASVIVLGYHQFTGPGQSAKNIYVMRQDVFEQEMKYLRDNGYHVVPLSDVVKFIKHEIGLPPNSVAITIDDGYKSAIVWAAPVLKKYGYPWTYFVYPDFITVNEGAGAASWNDLLALQAGGVDIESHSMTHPFLTSHHQKIKGVWHNLSPAEYDAFLTTETAGAKALLEQKLGKPVLYFAYPYGAYNKEVEAKAIAAGYDAIFTVADNPVHTTTIKSSIGRYVITQPVEKNFAAYLRQGAIGLADADPAPGSTIGNPRPIITAVLGYDGNLDPKSIETEVRDYGAVHHDYDPKTSTIRLYLPRDLVQSTVVVNIRVKDADTGQVMVANWHFNYEPDTVANAIHPPIAPPTTNAAPASTVVSVMVTNAVTSQPDPPLKSGLSAPLATPKLSPH
jgi:peptidoglycan/xylan/chitin deacetylase (PgdA/CDA1 family)